MAPPGDTETCMVNEIREASDVQNDSQLVDTVDAALEQVGCCNSLRLCVSIACIIACVANSFSLVCASLAMPAAECDLRLSSVQLGLLNGASFSGMLAGALVWGAASDAAGRRLAIVSSMAIGSVSALAACSASAFWALLLLRCLAGVGAGGSQPAVFSYFAEWQPRRVRGPAVSGLSSCWMLGGMIAAAIAWLVLPRSPDWRLFSVGGIAFGSWRVYMALCAVPYATAMLLFLLFLPESPTHLIELGKIEKARTLLRKMTSKHTKGDCDYQCVVQLALKEKPAPPLPVTQQAERTVSDRLRSVLVALLDRCHRRRVLLLAAVNSATAFSYYGLLLWFPVLFKRAHQFGGGGKDGGIASVCANANGTAPAWQQGDNVTTWSDSACDPDLLAATRPYAEAFLVNASNLPGNLASMLLVNRVGRRCLLATSLLLMAASVGLIGVVWSHAQAIAFSCAFAAVSSVAWNSISVISAELLPNRLQASALGFGFALARISSMCGTVLFGALVDDGCLAPMTLSAGVLVLSALLVCALPSAQKASLYGLRASPPLTNSPSSPAQNGSPQTAISAPTHAPAKTDPAKAILLPTAKDTDSINHVL